MRRDVVTEVIVDYGDFAENFATVLEAKDFINGNLDELDWPVAVWLEDSNGRKNGTTAWWMMELEVLS